MRSTPLALVLVLFLWSPGALAQPNDGASTDLLVSDVTIISPERTSPLEHAYVRISGGKIEEVSTRPLSGEQTIDGSGLFLIPGLIDSHVHLGDVPGMRPDHVEKHPEIASAYWDQLPRSYLYFGFTSVVELLGSAENVARFNEADVAPDAYFCGGAPVANGYPMVFTPEDLRFQAYRYFLYDERQKDQIPSFVEPAEHTPEAVVRRMASDGAICVKTTYETGFGGMRNLPTPTLEMLDSLAQAAHDRNMPMVIHANSKEAQEFAVEARADIIAHGLWNGISGEALASDVHALLDAIAAEGIGYQPTFQVLYGEVDLFEEDFFNDGNLQHAYPATLIDWYRTAAGGWFREEIRENLPPGDALKVYAPLFRRLEQIVATLAASDARLLFGSDTPSAPTYANPPGLNGLWEVRRWADAGVSEHQIFRALTLDNARAFGLEAHLGSVESGKAAHLLLLRENPLESVEAYDSIETVILDGQPIDRERLSARSATAN